MSTRKITSEIEDSLLAACVYFLDSSGIDVQGCTSSEVVNLALKTFATFLHGEGLIPEGGIENPTEYLNSKLQQVENEQPPASRKDNLQNAMQQVLLANQTPVPKLPDDKLQSILADATDYGVPEEVPEPVPVAESPTETAPIDLEHPPWDGVDSIEFAELQAAAPKDVLIEYLTDHPDNVMQKAVEVVYAVYPINHWSSDACTQLVRDTADKFKPYASLLVPKE